MIKHRFFDFLLSRFDQRSVARIANPPSFRFHFEEVEGFEPPGGVTRLRFSRPPP